MKNIWIFLVGLQIYGAQKKGEEPWVLSRASVVAAGVGSATALSFLTAARMCSPTLVTAATLVTEISYACAFMRRIQAPGNFVQKATEGAMFTLSAVCAKDQVESWYLQGESTTGGLLLVAVGGMWLLNSAHRKAGETIRRNFTLTSSWFSTREDKKAFLK